MNKQVLKIAGTQVAKGMIRRRVDISLGFVLLRDKRVPLSKKIIALLLGGAGMLAIQLLEIPIELLTVIFGSPIGVEDGIEAILWPIIIASAILPNLIPVEFVDQFRAERAQRL